MPSLVSRGRGRRTINEINMVPFIDVMLVLLIIFMVSAPLITTGMVELPSVGKSAQRPAKVIEVVVASDEKLRLRIDGGEPQTLPMVQLGAAVLRAQGGDKQVPVVISADKNVRYEEVIKVMDLLQQQQIKKVGLLAKVK